MGRGWYIEKKEETKLVELYLKGLYDRNIFIAERHSFIYLSIHFDMWKHRTITMLMKRRRITEIHPEI